MINAGYDIYTEMQVTHGNQSEFEMTLETKPSRSQDPFIDDAQVLPMGFLLL
jgi:hypothetical protein